MLPSYDPLNVGTLEERLARKPVPPEVLDILDHLKGHGKDMWLPQLELGEGDPKGSRFYGRPWMLEGEPWPLSSESGVPKDFPPNGDVPMSFIFQIDIACLPKSLCDLLGGKGLLQFFFDNLMNVGEYHLRIVDTNQPGGCRDLPRPVVIEHLNHTVYPKAQSITNWVYKQDFPSSSEWKYLNIRADSNIMNYSEIVTDCSYPVFPLNPAEYEDKIGGWERWFEHPDSIKKSIPKDSVLIITCNSYDYGSSSMFEEATLKIHYSKIKNQFYISYNA